MKQIFYNLSLLMFLIFDTTSIFSQPISITVNVETAGNLSGCIASNKKDLVEKLKVTGKINGTDINYLRKMAMLSELDLSGVSITYGGDSYASIYVYGAKKFDSKGVPIYSYWYEEQYSKIDRLTPYIFRKFTNITSLILPNTVKEIEEACLYGCKNLKSLTLGENIQNIKIDHYYSNDEYDYTFSDCSNLKEIKVADKNIYFTSINGILYSKSKTRLVYFPPANSTSVSIPKSVTSIGDRAFYQASKLKEIHCQNPIPPSTGVDIFGADIFTNVDKKTCKLYVPKGSYSAYWIAGQWGDFSNIIEEDISTGLSPLKISLAKIYSLGNVISVSLPDSNPNARISVYDITGRLIISKIADGSLTTIPISKSGVYVVTVDDGQSKSVEKVIVNESN